MRKNGVVAAVDQRVFKMHVSCSGVWGPATTARITGKRTRSKFFRNAKCEVLAAQLLFKGYSTFRKEHCKATENADIESRVLQASPSCLIWRKAT